MKTHEEAMDIALVNWRRDYRQAFEDAMWAYMKARGVVMIGADDLDDLVEDRNAAHDMLDAMRERMVLKQMKVNLQ